MEVEYIERVIFNLPSVQTCEMVRTDLEFEDEYSSVRYDNCIDPTAEAKQWIFQ